MPTWAEQQEERIATAEEPRINDRIRVREVRLVAPDGEQIGIQPTDRALYIARELGLDLVEVAPSANPPVCRIMDYGKYKYEQAQKAKESRKKQSHIVVKEIKMRPKIDRHDYETKRRHVVRFVEHGDKVKVTIMFRGREVHHPELGARLLERLAVSIDDMAFIEASPKLDGRNMTMVLSPHRDLEKRLAARRAEAEAAGETLVDEPLPPLPEDEDDGDTDEGGVEEPDAVVAEPEAAPVQASADASADVGIEAPAEVPAEVPEPPPPARRVRTRKSAEAVNGAGDRVASEVAAAGGDEQAG